MDDIKLINWATRPGSVGRNQPFMTYLAKNGVKKSITIPFRGIILRYCSEKKSRKKILKEILNTALNDLDFHFENYKTSRNKLFNKAKKVCANFDKISNKDLFKLHRLYFNEALKYGVYLILPFALNEYLEPEIFEKFPNDFKMITSPDKLNIYQQMTVDLLKNNINKVYQKYKWFSLYSIHERPYNKSFFVELKNKINQNELNKTITVIQQDRKDFQKFIKTVKNIDDRNKCILLHEYAFLRTDRIDTWKMAMYLIQPFYLYLAKLHPEKNCTLSEIVNITNDEIEKILIDNKYPSRLELKKRLGKDLYTEYFKNGQVRFTFDNRLVQAIEKSLNNHGGNNHEIKGFIANKGKIQGKVVVIKSNDDLKKVMQNNIMVAVVTSPAYTPYMKKCSAIITDEGGITCHAAIVSRELGIPCIIGTKIATKVLKDGDLVEVDTEKGIVKRINYL